MSEISFDERQSEIDTCGHACGSPYVIMYKYGIWFYLGEGKQLGECGTVTPMRNGFSAIQ